MTIECGVFPDPLDLGQQTIHPMRVVVPHVSRKTIEFASLTNSPYVGFGILAGCSAVSSGFDSYSSAGRKAMREAMEGTFIMQSAGPSLAGLSVCSIAFAALALTAMS